MKRALVTGASEGIGYQIAEKLAANGYKVTVVARNAAKLSSVANEIGGGALVADLATEAGVTAACDRVLAEHCDVVVNKRGRWDVRKLHRRSARSPDGDAPPQL